MNLVIFYELITGMFEALLGIGLIFLGKGLDRMYENLRASGFLGSYHDLLVSAFEQVVPYLVTHHVYIGLFLFGLGITKVVSGFGLRRRKAWAKHLLKGLLAALLPFDVVGLFHNPTMAKVLLLSLNVFVLLILLRPRIMRYVGFVYRFGKNWS